MNSREERQRRQTNRKVVLFICLVKGLGWHATLRILSMFLQSPNFSRSVASYYTIGLCCWGVEGTSEKPYFPSYFLESSFWMKKMTQGGFENVYFILYVLFLRKIIHFSSERKHALEAHDFKLERNSLLPPPLHLNKLLHSLNVVFSFFRTWEKRRFISFQRF